MKTTYFNHHEFLKALDIRNTDINLSIARFEEYLEKYPNDYAAMAYYISSLVTARRIDEAAEILKKLEELNAIDKNYLKITEKNERIKSSIIYCKIKLLIYQNKFKECYDILMDNYHLLLKNDIHFEATALYCKKKLGYISNDIIIKEDEYLFGQIVSYSEERFLNHIKKHLTTDEPADETVRSIFNKDFPIERVFAEIKTMTPSNHAMFNGLFEDMYIYKYDFCGKDKNKNTDFIKVIACHDTDNFITMCPCIEGEYLDYVDLNYLKEDKVKQKCLRGIDRFNKRYGKNS